MRIFRIQSFDLFVNHLICNRFVCNHFAIEGRKGELSMRLLDDLRNAERRGAQTVRRGMERVREEWEDMERRIRQRMRIYPQKLKNVAASRPEHEHETDIMDQGIPAGTREPAESETKKPIVSVHGRDISEEDLNKSAA
jgi:hypothetical protein